MQTQYQRLSDPQWAVVKACLPLERKRKYALRDIVDAILWYLRLGAQWRNLPACFPPWQSVYYYFRRWQRQGVVERLNNTLNQQYRLQEDKNATPSQVIIDSQSIKAAPFVSEEKGIDGNKKINGRKRHVLTDTLGLIWSVVVHAANEHDGAMAEKVVAPLQGYLHRMKKILADHAYEKIFINWVQENMLGVEVEITAVPPSTIGFVPVKWRWIGERSFGCLNFFRRLDKDHEKTVESSEAWVLWANCQMVLNKLNFNT